MIGQLFTLLIDEDRRQERYEQFQRIWYQFTQNTLTIVGSAMVLSVVVIAVFAPVLAPFPGDANAVHFGQAREPPSEVHLMGTDSAGRDILSRVLLGSRIALVLAVVVTAIAVSIGTVVGLVAGYMGGLVRDSIMRLVDVFLAVPPVLLALVVTAILSPNLVNSVVAISFVWWTWYARLVQGEVISVKEEEFIEASESIGSSKFSVIFKQILPNVVSPITVQATLDMGAIILLLAGLSFLGLGASPPTPSWGLMIAEGRTFVTSAWWISTFPGLAISWTVLGFNLLGDGIRDIFDVETR